MKYVDYVNEFSQTLKEFGSSSTHLRFLYQQAPNDDIRALFDFQMYLWHRKEAKRYLEKLNGNNHK